MTKSKVRFLESEIIEQKANDVLNKAHQKGFYDFNSSTPIDLIVEIILELNINFADLNKDFEGVLGALDIKNQMIWLDESLNHTQTDNFTDEARCNFTIAHECGHHILHQKLYDDENMTLFHDIENPKTKMIETQANMFASHILMPTDLIMKKWSKIDYQAPFEKTLSSLTEFFKVSREALIIRLKTAELIDRSYQ
ncbi:MAG: Zn-dependent peptidase ImmA (M78 family) [Rickettsiales bacterium]|jgi:Zn-dependent peptidase ImmA (M78 family)